MMLRADFVKLIGAEGKDAEYVPFAALLRSGHACCGYYNAKLNADFQEVCVVLNANLVELTGNEETGHRASIEDFGEFLEEIVHNYSASKEKDNPRLLDKHYGKSIPLTAVALSEISVVYPVAHIESLMSQTKETEKKRPTFLDFEKSEILRLLRKKLW